MADKINFGDVRYTVSHDETKSGDSMIERVARALCAADGKDPDADWRRSDDNGPILDVIDDDPENWRFYVKTARAAIEAMLLHAKENNIDLSNLNAADFR